MLKPRPAILVLHGKVAMRDDVRAAVQAMRGEGHALEVRVTWEGGDAARLARAAVVSGAELVIAGGGDGTVNEVAGGMLDAARSAPMPAALAILPLGTANDLARSCDIPLDPTLALRLAMTATARPVDVGRANGRWFMNVATGGFGTQVTVATPNDRKKILGSAAYVLTGVTHFSSLRPSRGRFSGANFQWEGEFLVLGVGNGRQAGGGHQLCPRALINDGLLDVRILPTVPHDEIPAALAALLRDGLDALERTVVSERLSQFTIETDEPMQINLDGEPISATHFNFEIVPGRLKMQLPDGCSLLG